VTLCLIVLGGKSGGGKTAPATMPFIHLVTVAEGASHAYRRYPEAHRPETPQEAVHLDHLLRRVWGGHPRYVLIGNAGRDWHAKSAAARQTLEQCWQEALG